MPTTLLAHARVGDVDLVKQRAVRTMNNDNKMEIDGDSRVGENKVSVVDVS